MAETIEVTNIDGLSEMKIGVLVRSTLTKMLNSHEISEAEIALMQTAEYSKKTFDIQFPLLRKASLSNGEKVLRYWFGTVEAYGEKYFICSEWYEVAQNNDRPHFMKWLTNRCFLWINQSQVGEILRRATLMTQNEAIIKAFQALGGIREIAEITSWINEKYGNQWKSFSTVMADMVQRSHGGNASSLEPKHFRVLKRVNRGKYRLLNY